MLDRDGERLGLRRVENIEGAFVVRKSKGQRTWGISALGPLRHLGLTVKSAYRQYAQRDGNVLYISLVDLEPRCEE